MTIMASKCHRIPFLLLVATIWGVTLVNVVSGSLSGQLEFVSKVLTAAEQIERSRELKADWEERVRRDREIVLPKAELDCDVSFGRSPTRPTSVHMVRPGDIDIISGFGDSISAGNGLGAQTLPAVAIENRGEVWSIGGDRSLEDGVVTVPNIIRKYNPNLRGASICASTRDNVEKSSLNVAEPGGDNTDMPPQANILVERLRADPNINLAEDWKLVTLFVGGNDLCAVCRRDKNSIENYYKNFDLAVQILHDNLTRTIVNLVPMFDITPVANFSTGIACDYLQWTFCSCARNSTTKPTMRPIQLQYFDQLERVANDPRYKRDDFTVVLQPHLRDMIPPIDESTGGFLQGFLSPDCFHPNRIAHQAFARWLWNGMLTPIGQKVFSYDSNRLDVPLTCPTEENPYIFTDGNSG